VYKTTNIITKDFYIGVHSQKLDSNIFDGYLGSNKILKRAVKKYGKDKFVRETILSFDNQDEAYEIESMIVCDKLIKRKDCYNLEQGGFGNSNLGKYVTENKIGIHALTFFERSVISKTRISKIDRDDFLESCSRAGKIGGGSNSKNKTGFCGMSYESQVNAGKASSEFGKQNKIGIFDPIRSKEISKMGQDARIAKGITNLNNRWYTDGCRDYIYTNKSQLKLSFLDFLSQNSKFKHGRIKTKNLSTEI
jgi:hypothetical protein